MVTRVKALGAVLEFDPIAKQWKAVDSENDIIARHMNAAYLPVEGFRAWHPSPGSEAANILKSEIKAEILSIRPTPAAPEGLAEN